MGSCFSPSILIITKQNFLGKMKRTQRQQDRGCSGQWSSAPAWPQPPCTEARENQRHWEHREGQEPNLLLLRDLGAKLEFGHSPWLTAISSTPSPNTACLQRLLISKIKEKKSRVSQVLFIVERCFLSSLFL